MSNLNRKDKRSQSPEASDDDDLDRDHLANFLGQGINQEEYYEGDRPVEEDFDEEEEEEERKTLPDDLFMDGSGSPPVLPHSISGGSQKSLGGELNEVEDSFEWHDNPDEDKSSEEEQDKNRMIDPQEFV